MSLIQRVRVIAEEEEQINHEDLLYERCNVVFEKDLRAWLEKEDLVFKPQSSERYAMGARFGFDLLKDKLLAELEQPFLPANSAKENVDEKKRGEKK